MNRPELLRQLAARTGLSQKVAGRVIDALRDVAIDQLAEGGRLHLHDFLTIDSYERPGQRRYHPGTGEHYTVPAEMIARVTIGKSLKRAVKGEVIVDDNNGGSIGK